MTPAPHSTRRERALPRRQRRRAAGTGVIALLIAIASVTGIALLTGDGEESPAASPPPASSTTTTLPPVEPATIATTKVDTLEVLAEPNPAAPPLASFGAATGYGLTTTMLVESDEVDAAPGWVPVLVPFYEPNSTVGWVLADDVALAETSYEIEISLSRHELVFLNAGEEVLSTSVILGTAETPTPPGRFYVTDPLNCNEEHVPGYPVAECGAAYGAFAIGISGLSETLNSFEGTIPQLAVHGTDLPDTELGKDLSNGCVRMPNDVVLEIARTTPLLGMPVTIVA